jgi:hypothetical protein
MGNQMNIDFGRSLPIGTRNRDSDTARVLFFDHTSPGGTTYRRMFCLCSPGATL